MERFAGSLRQPLSSSAATASDNCCHNPAIDPEWERLLQSQGDPAFSYLYWLRQDLCDKVDRGKITLTETIDRFEAERQCVVNERLERPQGRQASAAGTGHHTNGKHMNQNQIARARHPEYSLPSILAIAAAIASFFFGAFLGFMLAITAIVLGVIGMVLAAAPSIRGGIISVLSIVAGLLGIIAAVFKLIF